MRENCPYLEFFWSIFSRIRISEEFYYKLDVTVQFAIPYIRSVYNEQ